MDDLMVSDTAMGELLVKIENWKAGMQNNRVANHVTSDDRVHGISENKLLNSGNIFLDIFVNTCQN